MINFFKLCRIEDYFPFWLAVPLKNLGLTAVSFNSGVAIGIPLSAPFGKIYRVYRTIPDGKYWWEGRIRLGELLYISKRSCFDFVIVANDGLDAVILQILFARAFTIGGAGETNTLLALKAHKEQLSPLLKKVPIYVWEKEKETEFALRVARVLGIKVKAFGSDLAKEFRDMYHMVTKRSPVTIRRFVEELMKEGEEEGKGENQIKQGGYICQIITQTKFFKS